MFKSYLACVLAITTLSVSVSALPVPAAATAAVVVPDSSIIPPVRGSVSTRLHQVAGLTRRAAPASLLRIVDEASPSNLPKADMRDPRNWISSSDSSSATSSAPSSSAVSRRRRSQRDRPDDSIFGEAIEDDNLFSLPTPAQVAHGRLLVDSPASLEPNGIHASLAAAMAVRQLEQRQAQSHHQQTPFPSPERPESQRERGVVDGQAWRSEGLVPPAVPASEVGRIRQSHDSAAA